MAKTCKVQKDKQRKLLVAKYAEKRKALKVIIQNHNSSPEEMEAAYAELRKLPLDSNPIRVRNRCNHTGRPRGYIRKFGLSRISFREYALTGIIPGVTKSSW